ncbi:MAG: translocation/assembly module TamB, partial [Paramuribaculum sp.]|nr:translocation/assembly module TamB [Paramuribaculum sp.]
AFNGDMLNPILNIHAVDKLKANVTQQGQNSRIIDFNVSVAITNTLSNMNVAFDLSTNDDITVQNELASMSPDQRANQAMNMLLYNVYSGPGTKASTNLSGNPLYSFLESQINSWAANNIRGVDISFGIDQYDKTTDGVSQQTTSYSYRVSKTLFNDRFKIIVGGNYSTDANADENFSQNLINDIAFEYMLNRSGSMYVRLFRHTGYESILEGEVTQTGVGFVLRRKINSFADLFRWAGRLKNSIIGKNDSKSAVSPSSNTSADETDSSK